MESNQIDPLPITFGFFTSTKGHFGRRTDWEHTLAHWNSQIPLHVFNLVAHLKVTPGEEDIAEYMENGLKNYGFYVIKISGEWSRGLSHGSAYLGDQTRMSMDPVLHQCPFFMLVEDDSPLLPHSASISEVLLRSCDMLSSDHELVSVRTIRKGDFEKGVPQLAEHPNGQLFYSPYVDFQPMILRSLDFYRAGMILESNPDACQQVQCEMVMRIVLNSFSRSRKRHLIWKPEVVESVHLGVPDPDYTESMKKLGLLT